MSSRLRPHLTYSNAIATIALFVALGGAAVAAGLPKGSVGPRQLKRGAVTTKALRRAAVRSGKLAPKSVIAGKLGPGAVLAGNLANGAVTTAKIANGAVIARSIKNSVVTTNKLNNNAVTTQKLADGSVTNPILANGSVTPGKLSDEFGPIVATLKSGQTLRGVFDVGGSETGASEADPLRGLRLPVPAAERSRRPTSSSQAQPARLARARRRQRQTPQAHRRQSLHLRHHAGPTSRNWPFDTAAAENNTGSASA